MAKDGRGGARKGSGRKPKAVELKSVERIKKAIRGIYAEEAGEDEEKAIDLYLQKFGQTKDGMKFFAEHLLGKAPDKLEIEDVTRELTVDEKRKMVEKLKKKLNDK